MSIWNKSTHDKLHSEEDIVRANFIHQNAGDNISEFDNKAVESTHSPTKIISKESTPDSQNLDPQGENSKVKLFENVIREIMLTLASKVEGYSSAAELASDFAKDTGYFPDLVANEFGFVDFETFLASPLLQPIVELQHQTDGKLTYFAKLDEDKFRPMRDAQILTQDYTTTKEERIEREKVTRCLLPENQSQVLEGKKRILEIVYELGGEQKEISWPEVQSGYLAKYGVALVSEELRRLFSRDKVFKILSTLCSQEFELYETAEKQGLIFLKMKRPYKELLELCDKAELNRQSAESSQLNFKKEKLPLSERGYITTPILPRIDGSSLKKTMKPGPTPFGGLPQYKQFSLPVIAEVSDNAEAEIDAKPVHVPQKFFLSEQNCSKNDVKVTTQTYQPQNTKFDNEPSVSASNQESICWEEKTHEPSLPAQEKTRNKYTSRCAKGEYTDSEVDDDLSISNDDSDDEVTSMYSNKLRNMSNQKETKPMLSQHSTDSHNGLRVFSTRDLSDEGKSDANVTSSSNANIEVYSRKESSNSGRLMERFLEKERSRVNFSSQRAHAKHIEKSVPAPLPLNHDENNNESIKNKSFPYKLTATSECGSPTTTSPLVNGTCREETNSMFSLMTHSTELGGIAAQHSLDYEIRSAECSFVFRLRNGNKILVLTDTQFGIKLLMYDKNLLQEEKNFTKCDWAIFAFAVHGLCLKFFSS